MSAANFPPNPDLSIPNLHNPQMSEKLHNKLTSIGTTSIPGIAIERIKSAISGKENQTNNQQQKIAAVRLLVKYENHIDKEHLPEIIRMANRLGVSLNKTPTSNDALQIKINEILKKFEKDISEYTKSHEVIHNATVMQSDYKIIRNGIQAFSAFVNFKIGDSRPILSFLSNFSSHFNAYSEELKAIKNLNEAEKKEIQKNTKTYGGETEQAYLAECKKFEDRLKENPAPQRKTEIVWHPASDSLGAARAFKEENPDAKIAIVNFANPVRVGGADSTGGKGSQEENIIRLTYLRVSLEHAAENADPAVREATGRYLGYYSAIVSNDIGTIGKNEKFGYITSSATDLRTGIRSEGTYLKEQLESDKLVEELNYRKLKMVFMAAAMENYDVVDLGAYGCGAFGNDPDTIAKTIKTILSEDRFAGVFSHIIFPINPKDKNFIPFKTVLDTL